MATTTDPSTMQDAALASAAPPDRHGLTILDQDQCWERLEAAPLGRLGFVADGEPRVVPVNHVVRDNEILFVSVAGSKLHAAVRRPGRRVVFEVDGYDRDDHTGWSVVVQGRLHPVDDLVEHTRHDIRGRPTWLAGYRDRQWLAVAPERVDGRVLDHGKEES